MHVHPHVWDWSSNCISREISLIRTSNLDLLPGLTSFLRYLFIKIKCFPKLWCWLFFFFLIRLVLFLKWSTGGIWVLLAPVQIKTFPKRKLNETKRKTHLEIKWQFCAYFHSTSFYEQRALDLLWFQPCIMKGFPWIPRFLLLLLFDSLLISPSLILLWDDENNTWTICSWRQSLL